jgi:hypothetical protein
VHCMGGALYEHQSRTITGLLHQLHANGIASPFRAACGVGDLGSVGTASMPWPWSLSAGGVVKSSRDACHLWRVAFASATCAKACDTLLAMTLPRAGSRPT